MSKTRIVFAGTPLFAVPIMEALIAGRTNEITAIITQPDKPAGRKQIITPPPVKVAALKHQLPVWQPDRIADISSLIKGQKTDLIVVVAYAQIIPADILSLPRYGCINIHGSLLPRYRGAACVQAALLNGDPSTGITFIKMDAGLDTGDIIAQKIIDISDDDTAGTLSEKLSQLAAKNINAVISGYISGELISRPQESEGVSYYKQLSKKDGTINWSDKSELIERHVRAMNPWPAAASKIQINGNLQSLRILETKKIMEPATHHKIGKLFNYNGELAIQCGAGALILKKIQIEGKKEITGQQFLSGYSHLVGAILQ